MLKKLIILYNTTVFLKWVQIKHQIINRLKNDVNVCPETEKLLVNNEILFKKNDFNEAICVTPLTFTFLNIKQSFKDEINWNYDNHGKLWLYNLEYFDFLKDRNISVNEKVNLIDSFYAFSIKYNRKLEPYPVSLRAINIIKFSLLNNINYNNNFRFLHQELAYLHNNYEFHLLGNHLLENGFAMILGGVFFKNEDWVKKAKELIIRELNEQILEDGGHFELSPMYHNIIFFRLLELIDWYSNTYPKDDEFLGFIKGKASKMKSYLKNIKFQNGDIPLFNDSAKNIALDTKELLSYSELLGIEAIKTLKLNESGYRSYLNNNYEIKVDVAEIGASYQAGHGHSDALSFILYFKNRPFLIEQGTSTYNNNNRRKLERATEAHNTVVVADKNQSEVWDAFRVGKRATTTISNEGIDFIEAQHDGYRDLNALHKRKFVFKTDSIEILDKISVEKLTCCAYLHFPDYYDLIMVNNTVMVECKLEKKEVAVLKFEHVDAIEIESFFYAEEFNILQEGKRIKAKFSSSLNTEIIFK